MVPKNQKAEAIDILSCVSFFLADDKNRVYYRFLDISGVEPNDDRIRLPLVLSKKIAKRISSTNKEWASLILEISENSYGVRLVAGKPKVEMPKQVKAFVGRDFGYPNTVSLSVVLADISVNIDYFRTDLDKLTSKE